MSNYPPGVTGSEPAIAGYPEGTYTPGRPCTGYMPDDCRAVPPNMIYEIFTIQERIGKAGTLLEATQAMPLLERLRLAIIDLPKAVDVECLYEGEVDAQWSGNRKGDGEFFWTCPQCGSEQEESREAGDDHPDL